MATAEHVDYEAVERLARALPPERRLALIEALASSLRPEQRAAEPSFTLKSALGLLRGDGPPPTDDDVKTWLNDARDERLSLPIQG